MKCGHKIITDGCKHCKALEKIWYDKLDINDAEDNSKPERELKEWHNFAFSQLDATEIEITTEYYDKALDLLHNFHFKNSTIKLIWELHCKGLSRLKIEIAISSTKRPYKQSQIRNIIKDLEREFDW
jgi:hypothetical protein